MMEQGSLADLLTLAKSGDDNKLGEMMAMPPATPTLKISG